MRLAILAALCVGLAVARWHSNEDDDQLYQKTKQQRQIQDSIYKQGREYVYLYNGQVLTGIPGSSRQHAGTRIKAVVVVQFKSGQEAALKLLNVRFGKLNQEISTPRRTQPFSLFEEVPIEQELKQKLQKPVVFTYTNGMVHNIQFEEGEQAWSANIKRGVLNMLQVNLKQHNRVETEELQIQNALRDNSGEMQTGKSKYYRVVEKTLEGECETIYEVGRRPDMNADSSVPVLNVTKSIDFETCKNRPQLKYNWRFNMDCPTCDKKYQDDEKFLKSSTVVKYNITGTRDQFMIESAEVESQYVYSPAQESESVVDSYVKQKLELTQTQPISRQIQITGRSMPSESQIQFSLNFDIAKEKFFMSGDQQFFQKTPYTKFSNKVATATDLLNQLIAATEDRIHQEAPSLFNRLVILMRFSTRAELDQIHEKLFNGQHGQEQQKRVREYLTSAAALAGTHDSIAHLLKHIREQKISPLAANFAIRDLLNVRVVSKEMIEQLKAFAHEPIVQQSQLLKQATWLTLGSLVNALCAPNDDQLAVEQKMRSEELCSVQLKKHMVETFFNQLRSAQKWEDQLTIMKAIANSGLDVAIFELEKIIQNRGQQYPSFLRVEAINALQNLRDQMPRKIRQVLLPIYMNPRERPEVRVTALYETLNTQPERPILEIIAKNLNNEPSRQVASFAYAYMSTLANSTNPCFQNMTSDLKLALRFTKAIRLGVQYSKLMHLPFHSENLKMGLDLNLANIMSNVSLIPFHTAATLDANFLGQWQRYLLTVGASAEGLEPLLHRVFGENGILSSAYNFEDMSFKRHPKNTNFPFQAELKQLYSQLKIQSRQSSSRTPKAWAYLKFKGQEMGFLPVSSENIAHLLQQNTWDVRQIEQRLRQGQEININKATVLQESLFKIPTALGLPLVFQHKIPVMATLKGKIQLEMKDNSYDRMVLHADLKPSAAIQSTQSITIWSPIVNTGIKIRAQIRAQLPVKGQIQAQMKQSPKQVKIVFQPPKTQKELIVAESKPITFNFVWPKHTVQHWQEAEEKTIRGEEHNRVKTVDQTVDCKLTGVQLKLRGRWHVTPVAKLQGTPMIPFSGPNRITVEVQPRQDVAEEIEIKLEGLLAQPVSGNKYSSEMKNLKTFDQFKSDSSSSSESQSKSSSQQSSQSSSQSSSESNSKTKSASSSSESDELFKNNQLKRQRVQKGQDSSEESFESQPQGQIRKNQLQIQISARPHQRQLQIVATHKYSADLRYNKLSAQMTAAYGEQPLQVCLNAEAVYPKQPHTAQEAVMKKIVAQAQLKWGQSCSSDKFVTVKVQAERSQAQKEYEERKGQRFQDCRMCQKQQQGQANCAVACYEQVAELSMLKKYTVDIDYQHVPAQVKNVTQKLLNYLKYRYYWQADVAAINVQNQQNKVQAKIYLDPESLQRINVTLKTPQENVTFKYIPLPVKVTPLNTRRSVFGQMLTQWTNGKYAPVCQISENRIRTFDGARYKAPISTCFSVLAKDCVEEGRFAVLMKKVAKNSQEKVVKIITPRHKIVLTVQNQKVHVQVNDQQRKISSQEEQIQERGMNVAVIQREGQAIKVVLPETGLRVYFDGYTCTIKVSPLYMSRQCGLCGEFDSENNYESEFMTPAFQPAKNMRSFHRDFTVLDNQCQRISSASFEKHNWQRSSESSSSESESSESASRRSGSSSASSGSSSESQQQSRSQEWSSSTSQSQSASRSKSVEYKRNRSYRSGQQLKVVLRKKIVEKLGMTCFSAQPVPRCPKNAFPIKYEQQMQQVEYRCLSNSDSRVHKLTGSSSTSASREIGTLLQHVQKSFTQQERVPKTCQRY